MKKIRPAQGRVRRVRKKLGLTCYAFAEILCVAPPTVYRWEQIEARGEPAKIDGIVGILIARLDNRVPLPTDLAGQLRADCLVDPLRGFHRLLGLTVQLKRVAKKS